MGSAYEHQMYNKKRKRVIEVVLFLSIMGLSFYAIFHGQDLRDIFGEIANLSLLCIFEALLVAVLFVSIEGCIIFYLLHSLGGKSGLLRCISYSFIGFFYSGITPSATGGQPMQLYYMKKDGNNMADSSVVLMIVALIYKFVLIIFGILMLIFWNQPLRFYLQGYFGLYLLGLGLNIILVLLLLGVMLMPEGMKNIILKIGKLLEMINVLKKSEKRNEKVIEFVDGYQNAVQYLISNKKKVCVAVGLTFLQRFSIFFLTYIIYIGFDLQGTSMHTIVLLQAAVYIAVDMLPIPGAQGITELMYQSVFKAIFSKIYLMSSLYVIRGISFYFLLMLSIVVVIINWICRRRRENRKGVKNETVL